MAIVRVPNENRFNRPFLRLDHAPILDLRLNDTELGILVRMLYRPDYWTPNPRQMASQFPRNGIESVRTGFKGLIAATYLEFGGQTRDSSGRFSYTNTTVREIPLVGADSATVSGKSTRCEPQSSQSVAGPEDDVDTVCWFSPYGEPESTVSGFSVHGQSVDGSTVHGQPDTNNYCIKQLLEDPPLPPNRGEGDEDVDVEAEKVPAAEVLNETVAVLPFPTPVEAEEEPEVDDEGEEDSLADGSYDRWIEDQLVEAGAITEAERTDPLDDFDTFFGDLYPEQSGMTAARKLWKKKPFTPDEKGQIQAALRAHLERNPRWKPGADGRFFLPAADMWLRRQRWLDPLPGPRLVSPSRSRPVCQHEGVDQHLTLGIWQCRDCPHELTPQELASRGLSTEPPGIEPLRQIQEQLARKGNA